MADKKTNKKTENDLIPQNIPSEEDISKYVEQLGRYEGTPKPPDTTYSDIGEYLNQRGEYKGSPVPSLVIGQDKISEYVNNLEGYTGKQEGSFEGTPVVHTNFKGAIDNEYVNPNLIPIDILDSALNMSPFRKQGSMVIAPGLTADTTLPAIPKPTGYTLVDMHKFQVDRDNKEITLAVYDQDAGSKVKMYITPYWNPSDEFSNCRLDKAISTQNTWISEWLELTEYYTTTLTAVPTNNTMTLASVDVSADVDNYFRGWFIVNVDWTRAVTNRYQFVQGYTASTNTIMTLGGLGHTSSINDWKAGDTIELVRFPVRSHYSLNTEYQGSTDNFTALPTSYVGKLNELRIACGKDNRPLIITDIKERSYFGDSEKTLVNFSSVSSTSITEMGLGYNSVPSLTITHGSGSGFTATANMYPILSDIEYSGGSLSGGSGYVIGDILELTNGTNITGKKLRVRVENVSTGAITQIGYCDWGDPTIMELYSAIPAYSTASDWVWTNISSSGSGAKIRFDWCVYSLTITNAGSGYTAAPTFTIGAPDPTGWTTRTTSTGLAYISSTTGTTGDTIGLKYDGLWFDFASIPQTLISSGVSGYASSIPIGITYLYLSDTLDLSLTIPTSGKYIRMTPKFYGSKKLRTRRYEWSSGGYDPQYTTPYYGTLVSTGGGFGIVRVKQPEYNSTGIDFELLFVSGTAGGTYVGTAMSALTSALNSYPRMSNYFTFETFGSGNFASSTVTNGIVSENTITTSGDVEATVGNVSFNRFLGVDITVTTTSVVRDYKNTLLLSCIVDNRNEILITQGTYFPSDGFEVSFNPWFSRRITGFNLYTKNISDSLDSEVPYFQKISEYPYYKWLRRAPNDNPSDALTDVYINETPLLGTYSTNKIIDNESAEYPSEYLKVDKTNGYNCYKWNYQYNKFYTVFKHLTDVNTKYVDLYSGGLGLKWIVNTNRYVDQDTTMNYTRAVFVGQTNGRYFISGCKNNVEYEELENDDMIFCNNYAVGVSQYDTFLRNSSISVQLGDKDIIRAMSNYGGYLTAIKDSNSYVLDVNTDDELKYRVVDTMNGRGTTFGNSLGETPYGIVMPTYDGVWLMSPSGVTPIMNYTNSKFNLYKTLFTGASDITTVYYNNYNEVMICMLYPDGGNNLCYIFTYNFAYKFWAHYLYTLTNIKKILGDSSRNVLFVDKATDYGVYKVSETTNTFTWNAQTHNMPYGDRFKQVYASWITILADYTKESNTRGTLTVTPIKDGVDQTAVTFNVDTTLYLKPDGTFVTSSPGTHYITITNTSNNIVQLRVILGAEASITKSSANTYDITVKNTVTTLQEVIDLINGVSSGLSIAGGGTPAVIAFTGPATKQSATFFKASRDDLLLDIPITFGSPANTFAVRISGTLFTRFNLNGIYVWLNTQNRVPFLR